ncbi:MAG: hypothetical protein JXR03_01235 [Cyclobacteriaceae bacterium]
MSRTGIYQYKKMGNRFTHLGAALLLLILSSQLNAQIVLLGENPPHGNVNDGDFSAVWDYWRNARQSPFWKTTPIKGAEPMGLHYGTLFSSNEKGIAESKILDTNPDYQNPKTGDILNWSFGADLEYVCNGTLSFSLVFGNVERILAKKVKLIGADKKVEHFNGTYTLKKEDADNGLPFVRVTFHSEQDVKVYLHYVNVNVLASEMKGPELEATVEKEGISLTWKDDASDQKSRFNIYRKTGKNASYKKIGETASKRFIDTDIINGVKYTYLVTRVAPNESGPSNQIVASKQDTIPPSPPSNLKAEVFETEIKLTWTKSADNDAANYSIFRGDENGENMVEIATEITKNWFEDILVKKGVPVSYQIYTYDHSGNRSTSSETIKAQVKTVWGASFSDLILPIPIHNQLSMDVWGKDTTTPRDKDNGIEHPDWSYWGGRPVKDKDEKYHMLVTRWPEGALKGHWEWPKSTVTHVVSTKPTGPYLVKEDLAYDYHDGLGHNPDIIKLNDGSYVLYSLIDWEPTIFTSQSMNGPWKREGVLIIDMTTANPEDSREYQYSRNLSGVQLEDGRILMVSKFGCMMVSENGLLGPYKIVTKTINENQTIPNRYRRSNYEDPVMWKDEVQFHLLINAFLDYRAIYLRSPDGINWTYDPGLAYTPDFTKYEDGTQTNWYKLERPHVLQDEYGRATHLSLAVIDVPKKDDYSNDNHNSKNIIIPLTTHKRLQLLTSKKDKTSSQKFQLLILSENRFDAQNDVNVESLRFGSSDKVNLGLGCKSIKTKKHSKGLLVTFEGSQSGITENDFVGKLLGRTKDGDLLIGFAKLPID